MGRFKTRRTEKQLYIQKHALQYYLERYDHIPKEEWDEWMKADIKLEQRLLYEIIDEMEQLKLFKNGGRNLVDFELGGKLNEEKRNY